jgi:hypothetical protein
MRYAHLTTEHQVEVLRRRLLELEGQHYQAELDKRRWLSARSESDDDKNVIDAQVAEIVARQEALDISYAADHAALEELAPKPRNGKTKV